MNQAAPHCLMPSGFTTESCGRKKRNIALRCCPLIANSRRQNDSVFESGQLLGDIHPRCTKIAFPDGDQVGLIGLDAVMEALYKEGKPADDCILGKPPPPAVRPEKAPPFQRASRLLLKAIHDYEHVHVNVLRGTWSEHPRAVDETRGR